MLFFQRLLESLLPLEYTNVFNQRICMLFKKMTLKLGFVLAIRVCLLDRTLTK